MQGGAAYNEYLEHENDAQISALAGKVTQLRELSINIGTHVRDDNKMLNDLDGGFDSAGSMLKGAHRHDAAVCSHPMRTQKAALTR